MGDIAGACGGETCVAMVNNPNRLLPDLWLLYLIRETAAGSDGRDFDLEFFAVTVIMQVDALKLLRNH